MLTRLDVVQGDQLLPVLPIVLAKTVQRILRETSDYTRKGGVMYSEIMLPPHAPMAYADRQTLWNAVEKAERRHDAQLAYSFDIALQNELTFEENLEVARAFLLQYFVGDGMTVDFVFMTQNVMEYKIHIFMSWCQSGL